MSKNLIDNKYIPLDEQFVQKGHILTKIHDFQDGWMVYERKKESGNFTMVEYELVKPKKQEEYEIHGNTVKAKIAYPSEKSDWGRYGFTCMSLRRAINKHDEIIKENTERDNKEHDIKEFKINLPKGNEFTIKEIWQNNKGYTYSDICKWVKNNMVLCGIRKNKVGKPSNLFKKNKI